MNSDSTTTADEGDTGATAEARLRDLGLRLPTPPRPLGTYVEAVRTGSLLFLSGMLPTRDGILPVMGRVGAELDVEQGCEAARLAALNALAVARASLQSLDDIRRVVRVAVSIATAGDFRDHPKVADGASDLFRAIFGEARPSCRSVYGVASLPLAAPVVLDVIFEVTG